jgi:hypothetical protein
MRLTDAQLRHFKTFGYLGIPRVFPPEDVAWITEEFEDGIGRNGGGKHTGAQRTMFGAPVEQSSRLATLIEDPRVTDILGGVLGDDFNYCGGDGNYYSGDTGWHPDGDWNRLIAAKLAFYLDPLTKDTGCLRVIPGSQDPEHPLRKSLRNWSTPLDPNKSMELYGVQPRDYPGNVALETNPGDLVIFNHDTWHAAFGGSARRRMFTMNCTIRAKSPEDLELLRKYLSIHSAGGYKVDTGAGMYLKQTVLEATPTRWVHLEQAAQIHDELFPQFALNRDLSKYPAPPQEVKTEVAVG